MNSRTSVAASAWRMHARLVLATVAFLLFVSILAMGRFAAGADLELRYYGADWCAPCHKVEPMVDRWAAEHPDLRIVKLDYDTHAADRRRFDIVGVPMLVLLEDDKLVGKYGHNAQKVSDFARHWLERWYESVRVKIDTARQ